MKTPKVSIISITYNQEKYVQAALEGMLMQETDSPIEIIISDDASTDKTPEIIAKYARKYPEIVKPIFRDKNVGAIANFIGTLQKAKSKYVAICEGDDYWITNNKLQRQVDFLEANPDYSICFHPTRVFYDDESKVDTVWPNIKDTSKISLKHLLEENFIPNNSVLYRRQDYSELPGDIMPFDWYLHAFHCQFGKIGFLDDVMSAYRRHKDSLWWNNDFDLKKHWKKYGLQNAGTFIEFLKMYGNDKKLNATICESIGKLVKTVIPIDRKLAEDIILKIDKKSHKSVVDLLINQEEELVEKISDVETKDQQIESLTTEILGLRNDVFSLREEVLGLRNARLLGRIIKTRDMVGEARKVVKDLPKKAIHKTRVVGAPLVPSLVRKKIKSVYKSALHLKNNLPTEIVTSQVWPNDIALVTVVIPYFNHGETLDETLDSLRKQTFTNFEVIIVDDGSSEAGSVRKIETLNYPSLNITVIRQANEGPASARNKGISKAKGKYIVCLDADDLIDPTYIEKTATLLEAQPDIALASSWMETFGVKTEAIKHKQYDATELYKNNMVITPAMFRKEAWINSGPYRSGVGYEDWDFWLSLSEHGYWGKLIPEKLFKYRVALQSRYIDDKNQHWANMKNIQKLHPKYMNTVKKLLARRKVRHVVSADNFMVNIKSPNNYKNTPSKKPSVLITVPWMTFGGAETLIYNYCREIKDNFNISFVTGLPSDNEWEYKFKEITPNIYHLANLFDDEELYIEFVANYIQTRNIKLLHIIHNGFTFKMLPELKKRFPDLKVAVTMFNDRVEYFDQSVEYSQYIDSFMTDNTKVADHYRSMIEGSAYIEVIPNGINCYEEFSPSLFDRVKERSDLQIEEDQLAIFFVGRLSVEKNPDVFINVADGLLKDHSNENLKFFVIGDGPMRGKIEQMIQKTKQPNISYLGYKAEVAHYFSGADIFVLPSSIEGFPLSILEAMAMRVAVIASDVGAISEVIENNLEGIIVKPGSVDEISSAITYLNRNRPKLTEMKKSARKKVESKYSIRLLGQNYKKAYDKLAR